MTRIKICGITNVDDALAAESLGADALGFIAVPDTPRFISPERYRSIADRLPPYISRVVVVRDFADAAGYRADCVQYYQEAASSPCPGSALVRRIRVISLPGQQRLSDLPALAATADALLLDTYHPAKLGGSGESFDWNLAVTAGHCVDKPIMLAGGLTTENVADALELVRPYAVDVSSGTERSPGLKDHDKIRAFIRAVREWDRRHQV